MMSAARIEARDRRLAAVHEAGHLVMARYLGCRDVSAFVTRNYGGEPSEKRWVGQTQFFCGRLSRLSRIRRQMIAVAGAAAETIWQRNHVEPESWYDPDFMSATDWEMANCPPGELDRSAERAVHRVADLYEHRIGLLWCALVSETAVLLRPYRDRS